MNATRFKPLSLFVYTELHRILQSIKETHDNNVYLDCPINRNVHVNHYRLHFADYKEARGIVQWNLIRVLDTKIGINSAYR